MSGSDDGGWFPGGGNGGQVEKTILENLPYQTAFQPMMPGQMQQLGNQLTRGYGNTAPNGQPVISDYLADMYQPMNTYRFPVPISTLKDQYKSSKHKDVNTGNAILDDIIMGKYGDD